MYKTFETLGSRLLGLFVPKVDADAACGSPYWKYYSSCWQCEGHPFYCGYWAACDAICRSGCGCQVQICYC